MIDVLICDDHELVRTAIARALEFAGEFRVVGQAATPEALLALLEGGTLPDVLLLDLNVGIGGVAAGLALIERVLARWPAAKLLVLSMHHEAEVIDRSLRAGARGFVGKGSSMEMLMQGIEAVHRGRRYVDPTLVDALIARGDIASEPWDAALTPREREVMARLCAGQRLYEIAHALSVSIKTVGTHKARLMEKLQVRTNAELIRLGHQHGLR